MEVEENIGSILGGATLSKRNTLELFAVRVQNTWNGEAVHLNSSLGIVHIHLQQNMPEELHAALLSVNISSLEKRLVVSN